MADLITVTQGDAPLIVSLPHTGILLPDSIAENLVSLELARHDTDWWVDRLYDFAAALGATMVHTAMSRTVIDVNRDPGGATLYPGQLTTGLCPLTTFGGRALYQAGREPDAAQISARRRRYFDPYHDALAGEITRLRGMHRRVVLYDCHSIRSVIPRLFAGRLPAFNIGSNDGASCDAPLTAAVEQICDASAYTRVTNGRFKGGWITRRYGAPAGGVHALQMELACATYMREDSVPWPGDYDADYAAPMRGVLQDILAACLDWSRR